MCGFNRRWWRNDLGSGRIFSCFVERKGFRHSNERTCEIGLRTGTTSNGRHRFLRPSSTIRAFYKDGDSFTADLRVTTNVEELHLFYNTLIRSTSGKPGVIIYGFPHLLSNVGVMRLPWPVHWQHKMYARMCVSSFLIAVATAYAQEIRVGEFYVNLLILSCSVQIT